MRALLTLAAGAGAAALLVAGQPLRAELDLARAGVARLENGLTVIVLEENSLPVVSTQVVYKSGSRDETAGKTGLAHFLEHLAFRASENFPNGAATSAIYDAGGEWHGYTWLDQTTYYSTMPADGLDLLLSIEADRMARVTIDPAAIEAEKGAVITEMRGYQNDPASVLFDAVVATAIQAHPYRNNTIGYESDVAALTVEDARDFYARHYSPVNAVLAIVGDVDPEAAIERARAHFAGLPGRPVPPRMAAVEPPQSGLRRIDLAGPVSRQYLRIAYPAPAASSPDFAPFLLIQQMLSGGSGINFRQNDWGTPSAQGSVLAGAADDMASWFIPTADPYVFLLSASIDEGADRAGLEGELESRIAAFSKIEPSAADLDAARAAVREQLTFDLETTEDAAHQLAFFEGIGAYATLMRLDDLLAAVTAADLQRVARTYLDPARRTIGWYGPGAVSAPLTSAAGEYRPVETRAPIPGDGTAAPPPQLRRLSNGLPAIVRPISLSPTASVLLVGRGAHGDAPGFPPGYGAILRTGMAADLPHLADKAAASLRVAAPPESTQPSDDPFTRLEQILAERRSIAAYGDPAAILAVVSGAVDVEQAFAALESRLSALSPAPTSQATPSRSPAADIDRVAVRIPLPLAQAAIGYSVAAPPPASREGLAARMLLYVLTHEYGGRLGEAAISDSGLVYYIGSDYIGDASSGRIEITAGVGPENIDAMEALMRAEIERLVDKPPSAAELDAARAHLLGRDLSAAMDNSEIALRLARAYLATGALPDRTALAADLAAIGAEDISRAAQAFASGTILRVDVGPAPEGELR